MNEEQMKQLMEMFNKTIEAKFKERDDAAAKKAEEEAKKREEEEKKKALEADKLKAAEERVKAEKEAKTREELEKQIYLDSFKYNSTIKDFLKDNAEFLPENLADIINVLEGKTYGSDVEKAQELKRAVIEQYIKRQDNLDNLPDSLKAKAEKFAGFTTKEKLDRAADFYDIVETGIHTAKNVKKVEAIGKSGNMMGGEKDAVKEYENNMLEFSKAAMEDSTK